MKRNQSQATGFGRQGRRRCTQQTLSLFACEEEWVWEKMMEFDKDNSLVDVSLTYRRSSAELKQDGLLGGGDGETTMTGGR